MSDTGTSDTGDTAVSDESTADEVSTDTPTTEAAPTQAAPAPAASAEDASAEERNKRKVREGIVTSDKMDRTAVVTVTERKRHPRYNKTLRQDKKLYVHDQDNDLNVGDRVRVMETRPLSKTKRWRVVEVLERAR